VWEGRQQPGIEQKLASYYYSAIFFAEHYFIFLAHLYSYNGDNIRLDIKSFPISKHYSNTLVHSSPHLLLYCTGRWVRLQCFFSNEYNRHDTTIYALDIDRHFIFYFISYCIENRHLCETLWNECLGWALKRSILLDLRGLFIWESVFKEIEMIEMIVYYFVSALIARC
jgi:hypothetical protein